MLRARGFGSQFGPQVMMMGGMGMMGPGMMGGKAFAARTMKSKTMLVQPLLLFARFATRSRLETDTLLLSLALDWCAHCECNAMTWTSFSLSLHSV